jgi:hypothetical protein
MDLLHNFFLECGARAGKSRVYEMAPDPTSRAMCGYLLVRGGVHIVAYAKALFTAIIFTVAYWRELVVRRPAWRWGVGAAFTLALLMTLVIHDTEVLHLPQRLDPMFRAQGWPDFAARLEKDRVAERANLLVASHYSLASLMTFYLPDRPVTYLPPAPYGSSQFTLWPGYQVKPDTRALFVTLSRRPVPLALQQQFTRIELVDDFWSQHHGHPMNYISVYLCTRE